MFVMITHSFWETVLLNLAAFYILVITVAVLKAIGKSGGDKDDE